ncbi:unnamed protein product [Scytosiphon promiscuus]
MIRSLRPQVEGRSGVAKLEACLAALPPTALRVVIVGVGVGSRGGCLEEELREVLESPVWTDSPERTIVVSPEDTVIAKSEERGDPATTSVRAFLKSRGVMVVDFQLPPPPPPPTNPSSRAEDEDRTRTTKRAEAAVASTTVSAPAPASAPATEVAASAAAAASAVSRELYRRGMLSAAWEVSPGLAASALQGGHIQRALVRRRPRPLQTVGTQQLEESTAAPAEMHTGDGQVPERSENSGGQDCTGDGVGGGEEDEEEAAVLRVLRRLSGSSAAVRLRRVERVFPWGAPRESCIEVLLPAAEMLHPPPPSASA